MKRLITTIFFFLQFIKVPDVLCSPDTLIVRLQNNNDRTLQVEMIEHKMENGQSVGAWDWPTPGVTIPHGVVTFKVVGEIHSELPCFVFRFFDDSNRSSAPSEPVCVENSYFLLPPLYPHVSIIN